MFLKSLSMSNSGCYRSGSCVCNCVESRQPIRKKISRFNLYGDLTSRHSICLLRPSLFCFLTIEPGYFLHCFLNNLFYFFLISSHHRVFNHLRSFSFLSNASASSIASSNQTFSSSVSTPPLPRTSTLLLSNLRHLDYCFLLYFDSILIPPCITTAHAAPMIWPALTWRAWWWDGDANI